MLANTINNAANELAANTENTEMGVLPCPHFEGVRSASRSTSTTAWTSAVRLPLFASPAKRRFRVKPSENPKYLPLKAICPPRR